MAHDLPVIDADGHVVERQSDIRKYLPEPWSRRPTSFWPNDQPWDNLLFGTLSNESDVAKLTPDEEIAFWLKTMDEHGMEYAVLFPTGSGNISKLREVEFANALSRAANTMFAKDYSSLSPRVKAVGVLPMQDPVAAAAELRYGVEELGLISFEILSMGLPFGLGDPIYEPVWAEAERLRVPLCIHGNRQSSAEVGGDRFRTFGEMHCYTFPAGLMLHFTSVLWNAIPLRYPHVKIAFLEIGATWLPYYLDRLDEHWELRGEVEAPHLTMKPSQLFKQSPVYVSLEAEETLLPETVALLGDEHFLYASDIPHWDNEFPKNLIRLREHPRLSRESKQKILYDNAQALFGIGARVGAGT